MTPTTRGRTVTGLIENYQLSPSYQRKAAATRRGYDSSLKLIGEKWGGHMVAEFSKPIMVTWYETLLSETGEHQAVALLRMMSILFSRAEAIGWRPENSNPCSAMKLHQPPPRDRYATWAEYDALIAAADQLGMPSMACAIALATLMAQRQRDVITAQIDAFEEMEAAEDTYLIWRFTRSKRKNGATLPVHPEAIQRVRNLIKAAKPNQVHLLTDHATGGNYLDGHLFRKRWAAIRAEAAKTAPTVKDIQFRDLRRTFGVWARAGGGTRADIGDVLGNSAAVDPILGETYMPPSFFTAARAIAAVQRPEPAFKKRNMK
ncbi:MAG: hypothetical protein CML60_07665 [Rhodobacteraceae bacterium]|nr:hypothetical protein [Paracoccaceae bacterium]